MKLQAHEQFCRESSNALQIAAGLIAIAMLLVACVFVMHLGGM